MNLEMIQRVPSFPRKRESTACEKLDSRFRGNDGHQRPGFVATGFTLIELMVVLVILGVLAALIVPKIMDRPDQARVLAAKQDLATIGQALKLYRLDNQRYPSTEQGLQALVTKPAIEPLAPNWKSGGYVEKLPKDPWGQPYQYLQPGRNGEFDVFSLGADGQPGGEDNDADIGNWMQ